MLHLVTNSLWDAEKFSGGRADPVRPRVALRIIKLVMGNPFDCVKHP